MTAVYAGAVLIVLASILVPTVIKFLNTDTPLSASQDVQAATERLKEVTERIKTMDFSLSALIEERSGIKPEDGLINIENRVVEKLEDRFKKNIEAEFISSAIAKEVSLLTGNIEKYIGRIQRNSSVNLVIGIIGTVTSIFILSLSIISDKPLSDIQSFLMHFLPRITFVIFIQLFAFFFLRLYKNNLEDAKYFQNELTNISAKSAALKIAYITDNKERFSEIIKDLSTTERNFKLAKEETLLNIEKAKIEKDLDLETITAFKDFLKTFKDK